MADDEIYAGAKGVVITLATGQPLGAATKIQIHARLPDGTEDLWDAFIATQIEDPDNPGAFIAVTPADGYITYTTADADLTQAGDYKLHAYLEWGTGSVHFGKTVLMEVLSKYS